MAAPYATTIIADEQFIERQRLFEDFLTSDRVYGERDYKELIREMLKRHERRLIININDLRQANPSMVKGLLQLPLQWIPPLQQALTEVCRNLNDTSYDYDISQIQFHIGFEGSFGALHTTPRYLSSSLLSHLVCLDGIITSCSLVRPKLLKSVHYSESRKAFLMREYWDTTMLNSNGVITSMNYPTTTEDGGANLESEFGLCTYRDYQTVSMQEMPEKAPAGQLPRTVDVILDDDLVDSVKPGDRVQIVGVYKSLASATGSSIPSSFRSVLIALNVKLLLSTDTQQITISSDDHHNIKAISRRRDVFDLLSRSLAPSIYGHEWVKKAVLLMLLGGIEKNLPNGTHLRGDINLMLVGDPSTAKSQMLRFVLSIAPLAIATTGRGSSGVGLTAAVTHDRETGERRLEAGAMVLADRGIVCIDEFDKMSDIDRVAIHEVMEQQTVTIAKAGIHASLNARCSVLAAANPIWGQYRETASPQENIRLPDSLLSRFDLLFIILDNNNPDHDRHISSHVLKMHRFIPPGLAEGEPINETIVNQYVDSEDEDNGNIEGSATAVFQKNYGTNQAANNEDEDFESEILTLQFLKKYIHYSKSKITPVLTKAATDHIVAAYAEFRQKRDAAEAITEAKTFPVTPRTLETLIRLATAHAKARLSNKVEKKDAKVAHELIQFCLYKEVKKKPNKRRRKQVFNVSGSDSEESSDPNDEDDTSQTRQPPQIPIEAAKATQPNMEGLSLEEVPSTAAFPMAAGSSKSQSQVYEGDSMTKDDSLRGFVEPSQDSAGLSYSHPVTTTGTINNLVPDEAAQLVRSALHRLRSLSTSAIFTTTVDDIYNEIVKENNNLTQVGSGVINSVLEEMQRNNQVMISEGIVYII